MSKIKNPYPKEIVDRLLECQKEQGNVKKLSVLLKNPSSEINDGGFNWRNTKEGADFWEKILLEKDFKVFYQKYPKYPRVMEVCHFKDFSESYVRVVFAEKMGRYIAWHNAETLEEAKQSITTYAWSYAREVPPKTVKLTMKEIAAKFGIPVESLKIKK